MMWDDAMREREEDAYLNDAAGPSTDNTSAGLGDDYQMDDADAGDDDEDEDDEWPLEKGMFLFEVSAKDGQGVNQLFDHLLANLIRRADQIQREKALRERNSVTLDASNIAVYGSTLKADCDDAGNPDSNAVKSNGWSCCSS
jgi:hypothetical protein